MIDSKISSYTWDITEGCTKVSAGCKNCYAERRLGERFNTVVLRRDRLTAPYKWAGQRRIFVNDTSDLFHDDVPLSFIDEVLQVIRDNPQHEFALLTKRPERLVRDSITLPSNTWFGVTAEDQEQLDIRTAYLPLVQSRIKYVSAQPLLGPLDLSNVELDWIIVGAEYGPQYRTMSLDWVRSIYDQTTQRSIPMLFQQAINNNERELYPLLDGVQIKQFPE